MQDENRQLCICGADPVAVGGSLLLLVAIAAMAAVLPARRAAQVNPIEVLRTE